ncbi:hypothetical protein K438DRAFT_1979920 [Mycena galopus ATCC 62051]|nr:hypothetical protein K438DRAFT_1979920 [Mycena galopus ATCC 62051]
MILNGVTRFDVLDARLRAPQLGCTTPPPCATPTASIPHRIDCFPCLPPQPQHHFHHYPLAQRSWSPFLITGRALRRWMRRLSASPGYHRRRSTPTRPTPCLRTLGLLSRVRDVPLWRSYPHVHRAAPPTPSLPSRQSLPRWSVTCNIRRDYQRQRLSHLYSTTTPRAISHATTNPLHAARDERRAIVLPMPYHADTLDTIPARTSALTQRRTYSRAAPGADNILQLQRTPHILPPGCANDQRWNLAPSRRVYVSLTTDRLLIPNTRKASIDARSDSGSGLD